MKINERLGSTKFLATSILIIVAAEATQYGVHSRLDLREDSNPHGLRGRSESPSTSTHGAISMLRSHHKISALQDSVTTHLRKGRSTLRSGERLSLHSKRTLRLKRGTTRRKLEMETGRCRRKKLLWYMRIRVKCQKGFGEDSKWDRSKMGGQCRSAFEACQTGYWSVCCSQPKGPKDLDSFCEKEEKEEQLKNTAKRPDAACQVQKIVQGVKKDMSAIKNTVILLERGEDGKNPQELAVPTTITATTVAIEVTTATTTTAQGAPPQESTPESTTRTAVAAPAPAAAAPTSTNASEQILAVGSDVVNKLDLDLTQPGLAPLAEASNPTSMATRCQDLMALSKKVTTQIHEIKSWAKNEGLRDVPGEENMLPDADQDAKTDLDKSDPDLAISLKSVLSVGKKLDAVMSSPFCVTAEAAKKGKAKSAKKEGKGDVENADESEDDAEDDSEDDAAEDEDSTTKAPREKAKTPAESTQEQARDLDKNDLEKDLALDLELNPERKDHGDEEQLDSDAGDEEKQETDDDEEDVTPKVEKTIVNETAILGLLQFDGELNEAVVNFETSVHPHGYKWWRYRYEYTIIESFVLAFSLVIMFILQWAVFGLDRDRAPYWHRTGQLFTMYRYASVYFKHKAAATCIMVCTAYFLYTPWGPGNIFDLFAKAFHEFVDEAFRVPYLGYSWLYLVLDIQFQLFVMYTLYAAFIYCVVRNYNQALEDWKNLDSGLGQAKYEVNADLFQRLTECMKERIRSSDLVLKQFCDARLYMKDVKKLMDKVNADQDTTSTFRSPRLSFGSHTKAKGEKEEDWELFKLHVYLTDALGHSIQILVEVSALTNAMLVVCALFVAVLAHVYQLAFMYFLPAFLFIGFVIFGSGFFLSKHYINLSEDMNHEKESKYITINTYCRAVQMAVYCIFYSFGRLIFSLDIFTHYPRTYLAACVSLVCVFALLAILGGELLKETMCGLCFYPHLGPVKFEKHLRKIRIWHTKVLCHECGTTQMSLPDSHSKKWAGKQQ